MTRSRISGETLLGSLSARDTVIVETPARLATSRMRAPPPLILFFGRVGCSARAIAVPSLLILPQPDQSTPCRQARASPCNFFVGSGIRGRIVGLKVVGLEPRRHADRPRRGETAVFCEDIRERDEPMLHYIVGSKPPVTRLQQILTQTAGFALLVMAHGGRVPMLDVPLALAEKELSSTADELRALRVPAPARTHHDHAMEAVAAIEQAIKLVAVCMRCSRDDPARAALTRRLRAATEHLRAASRLLPGFDMVDLRQACCAY